MVSGLLAAAPVVTGGRGEALHLRIWECDHR